MPSIDDADSNVVPFKLSVVPQFTATEEDTSSEASQLGPEKAQMYLAISAAAEFLLTNKDKLEYFVLGATIREEDSSPEELGKFVVATSPIKLADFCLALKLLDISVTRSL